MEGAPSALSPAGARSPCIPGLGVGPQQRQEGTQACRRALLSLDCKDWSQTHLDAAWADEGRTWKDHWQWVCPSPETTRDPRCTAQGLPASRGAGLVSAAHVDQDRADFSVFLCKRQLVLWVMTSTFKTEIHYE